MECVRFSAWPHPQDLSRIPEPNGTVDRAAWLITKSCTSDADLPTFARWATFVAMSSTQLRSTFYFAGVVPRDARDFMRILRLLVHSKGSCHAVAVGLDCRDYRTLRCLLQKAGLAASCLRGIDSFETLAPNGFIERQKFLPPDHVLTRRVVAMLVDQEEVSK